MHQKNNKIIYTASDFEDTVKHFSWYCSHSKVAIFSIYQGSLTLGHRLSKEYNLPHSIIKFQSRDGDDVTPKVIYNALDEYSGYDVIIIDDIFDTGKTLSKCIRSLESRFEYEKLKPASIRGFAIFSNERHPNRVGYQHLNKSKQWVHFEPWEGPCVA